MKEVLGEKVEFLVARRLEKMGRLLSSNSDNIQNDFEAVLRELTSDKKEGSLVISFLRSSYILNNHELYIAYYEGEPFVEEDPACAYFSMKSALSGVEKDWLEMNKDLCSNFIRVFAGEKEEIRRWYMEQLYTALESIIKMVVKSTPVSGEIGVYYGGYMEEVKAIGNI
ncbi:MAG: hypothetical protein NC489_27875 [Ruminococcus flavefaciens]|nr:hypothetical protein [Ruminococcus flavefaciens]